MKEIDLSTTSFDAKLFLCSPNKQTIGELKEAYDRTVTFNYGGLHEISFKLPYLTEKNKLFRRNPYIDNVRGHYLIRYEEGNTKEYFVISKPRNKTDNGVEVKEVSCFLYPYKFSKKKVRSYKGTKKLEEVLNDTLLRMTNYTIGYIDADIAIKYRTFDVSETSLIDFINDLSDTFDAIVEWDTVNETISFKKDESIGVDKGLSIEYGKYLKSLIEDEDFDNVVTHLKIYGKDNLSINKVNPTGVDFLVSYDYYLYPFLRDENRNVIKHSNYMADDLCHAILDYQEFLESKQGQFSSLLTQKEDLQKELAKLETLGVYDENNTLIKKSLSMLKTELQLILDSLDVAQASGTSTTQLIIDRDNKQGEIDTRQIEIDNINSQISIIDSQISTLKNEISMETNFTENQLSELIEFINEDTWTDTNYTDEKELYEEGKKRLFRVSQPLVSYDIDIVDFLKVSSCKRDHGKLRLGDIVTIKYPNFNINIKAKIISIQHGIDSNSLKLTIANSKDIKSGFLLLKDMLKRSVGISSSVDMSKYKWDLGESANNSVHQILNNDWDANTRVISAGTNENYTLDRRGLTLKDPNDPDNYLRALHNIIALTNDGGLSFKHAITPQGIIGARLIGQIIIGENLIIDASDSQGIKTFTVDSTGVKIRGTSLTIEAGLPESQINSTSTAKWNSAESNAKTYTDTQITEVNTAITTLEADINNFSSDLKITLSEANSLENTLNQVKAESTDLISVATTLLIATEKTNYSTSLSTLETEINKWINQASYPKNITTTDRSNIKTKLEDVQNKKSILINKINAVREANSKSYTDTQVSEIDTTISGLQTSINNFSSDSKITLAEANSLELGLNQVKKESLDLIAVATTLSITTEKTNYSTALTNLETEIGKWINQTTYPKDITSTDRTNIQTKFESVQNTKSILANKIASKREENATAVANTAQTAANNAQTSANTANNKLADIASDSKLTESEKQATKKEWDIIVGEKPIIDAQSATYGFASSTEQTNYTNVYNTLNNYLNNVNNGLLLNLTTSSDIFGTTFRSNFKSYYDAKVALLKKIAEQAKTLADNAQAKADSSVQQGAAYNGVVINTANGLVVTRSDNKVRTIMNASTTDIDGISGFKIQSSADGINWTNVLYADTSGNFVANKLTAKELKIQDAAGNVLIDASTGVLNVANFNINGTFSSTNIPNLSASKITSGTIDADTINVTNLNASNLTKGGIDGNTITITNLNASNITTGTLSANRINGGTLTGVTIDVTTNAKIGNQLILRDTNAGNGIQWGTQNLYSINVDAGGQALNLDSVGGVYANGNRIDIAPVAKFG